MSDREMEAARNQSAEDNALDDAELARSTCDYVGCEESGPPTVITALHSHYHNECYRKRQREIWGD